MPMRSKSTSCQRTISVERTIVATIPADQIEQ
jgi:hypothetical protein